VRSIRRCGVRRWRNTKSGAAFPKLGETAPLAGAYSIVRGGPRVRPGCRCAALRAAGLGHYQRFFKPGSGRREGIGLIVVCKHLLVVYVEQPTVTDAVDAVWTDTGRRLDVLLLFTFSLGETPTRRSSPSAGLPPEPDVPLPRAGSATEMPKRVDARRTAPRVRQRNGKRGIGGWRKTQFAKGSTLGELPSDGRGEERSAVDGYVARRRAGAIWVAMASVRSVVAAGPERIGPAVKPLLSQQLHRRHDEAAGAGQSVQPQWQANAKQFTAPPVMPLVKGMPGTPCCFRLPPPSVNL